jgi:hypothetical protein
MLLIQLQMNVRLYPNSTMNLDSQGNIYLLKIKVDYFFTGKWMFMIIAF